ncbi:MAG TPA: inositol monophosphatase family protein [Actinomycetaceae bacterium]|nr:inositol monophosphatase family protein [Actinomycetaceae bacterium]
MAGGLADIDVGELREIAVAVADEAAQLAQSRRGGRLEPTAKSSAVDLVTAADREVEALIRRRLAEARPRDGILGEEEGAHAGDSGLTWVIDPIDGTTNYVYGLDSYAVSIAVVAGEPVPPDWRVLAGCVHAPALGTSWSAEHGGGAYRGAQRLEVSDPPGLDHALLATGFGYAVEQRRSQAAVLNHVLPQVRDIRRLGAAAVDLCLVASGAVDGYYEQFLNPWDVAAGWLVVTEAGGEVRQLHGAGPGQECLVAGGRLVVEGLSELLPSAFAGAAVSGAKSDVDHSG